MGKCFKENKVFTNCPKLELDFHLCMISVVIVGMEVE